MPALHALGELGRIAGEHELDAFAPSLMPPAIVAVAEARQNRAVDDDVRHGIGENWLEPAADLDAHFALIGSDDQEDAVILLLGADAPMAAKLIAEILDGEALQ